MITFYQFTKYIQQVSRGFTLLETLVSIAILALVIVGPLSVISSSSGYARQTKDIITATYLAEEGLELVGNQYASLYIFCKKQSGDPLCASATGETSGQITWRVFKARFSAGDGQPSCFLKHEDGSTDNPDGCSYDFVDMTGDITSTYPVRYVSSNNTCKYITGATTPLAGGGYRYSYICRGVAAHYAGGVLDSKGFSRSVSFEQLPTFESGPMSGQYNDDLRVTVQVGFRGINGLAQNIKIIRFMHSKI